MGLSNIRPENPIEGVPVAEAPTGYFGKMHEISVGKDSMDGHWEMMGLPVLEPLGFFPQGFPQELIDKLEKFSGRHIIVNKPYSGTDVIHDYGEHQMETGDLIVYTSGDSVLQIAAHEDVIPLEELYKICEYARSITIDKPYRIGRIIARPYVGPDKDHFTRTANRHDFALEPTDETDMDRLKQLAWTCLPLERSTISSLAMALRMAFILNQTMTGWTRRLKTPKKTFTASALRTWWTLTPCTATVVILKATVKP